MKLTKSYGLTGTVDSRLPSVSYTTDETGVFEAMVSVFNAVDYQNDRVMPGSFVKSIERWRASGNPVPILWSHSWDSPFAHVGSADPYDIREVQPGEMAQFPQGGLYVKGRFDQDNEFARQVSKLVKERRVTGWSFSYDTIRERKASDGSNHLLELDLIEAGPTLRGAQALAATISAKGLDTAFAELIANRALVTSGTVVGSDGLPINNRVACSGCGRYVAVELSKPITNLPVAFGMTPCCHRIVAFSPKSWPKSRFLAELKKAKVASQASRIEDTIVAHAALAGLGA